MKCVNRSVGASFLSARPIVPPFASHSGFSLVMSSEEKELICRPYVEEGILEESILESWKNKSYDRLLSPYIRQSDIIVIDHGYNDAFTLENEVMQQEADVDWESRDKFTFVGAFNCLYDFIKQENPNAIVLIGGYFQSSCTISYTIRGQYVEKVCGWIADHYSLPLLDVWNYTNIPDGYMPESATYLDEINASYGKNFTKIWKDSEGNITYFQKFCPDGVHPFSDPTGESNALLNDIVCELLKDCLVAEDQDSEQGIDDASFYESCPKLYGIDGTHRNALGQNLNIVRYPDGHVSIVVIK